MSSFIAVHVTFLKQHLSLDLKLIWLACLASVILLCLPPRLEYQSVLPQVLGLELRSSSLHSKL